MRKIGEVAIMEKPIPEPGPNDAIVKTTTALVCTSDVHTVKGAIGERTDITLGHEACGVVYKLGSQVKGFKEGDRVVVCAITPCYTCHNCQRGFTSQCTQPLGGWKFANIKDGNMAEYFHVNDAVANLTPIPADVSDEAAVYTTDMMSTGFKGAENADIVLGGTAAVFGLGPVGLMAAVGARLLGAGLVIGVDKAPQRMKLAKEYGVDEIVDLSKGDPVASIMKLTHGEGVDSAMEAVGAQAPFEDCIKATRPGGTISNIGYHGEGEYLQIPRLEWGVGMAEKTIKTLLCPGGNERMSRLLRLIQTKRVDPTKLTTHRFKFADIEKAFRMMDTKEDNIIKPIILFN
ncbi:MAG: NAD(P)-dependent alcohol dehydrogenase [Deltaproteobacteria bacterium]|nr:NAD(P)-dependent alcohol dehydrogenase [Deltaproteobacteria bacterium]